MRRYIYSVMTLPLYPFERIAKKAGARRVSREAAEELRDAVEEFGMDIAEKAVKISKHANRRTVMKGDVLFVARKLE
ncbi:MAG: histone family protein [Candidatus Aenigmarchaeota archaeon]|nr:histone family protein [Candidatus Aenigmarchaeota archaeon]